MPSSKPTESFIEIAIRYFVFTAAIFALILGIIHITPYYGAELFSEGSILEWMHVAALIMASIVFILVMHSTPALRELSHLLACLPLLAVFREMDQSFDAWIPVLGWNLPFYLVVGYAAVHGHRHRKQILAQLPVLYMHRSFALMWSGLMVAIPFAQLVGHGPFLETLFGADYERPMKRVIEEVSEAVGYLMILMAAIDWRLYAARVSIKD